MHINEIIEAINNRDGQGSFISDWQGVYDMNQDEAERIAAKATSLEDFENIWRNETWWTDEAQ